MNTGTITAVGIDVSKHKVRSLPAVREGKLFFCRLMLSILQKALKS